MRLAYRWYGPDALDVEIVGPFEDADAAVAWGKPRGFHAYPTLWSPQEYEKYDTHGLIPETT
jgi:hypothetical protein